MNLSKEAKATAGEAPIGVPYPLPEDVIGYYKSLVGQIEIAMPQQGCRVLMVSSSIEGEGSTEVTVGLGLALAATVGRKTAIVDCNVHHPDLHVRFGTPETGLGEYLAGEVTLEQALANTVVPNMYIMPVGKRPVSLVAYGKPELDAFVADLRRNFECVLIDAAPIGTYPECAVLCDKVDSVILVVKHGRTRREVVTRTREIINRAGGRILGVVLNRRRFPIPEFLYKRL